MTKPSAVWKQEILHQTRGLEGRLLREAAQQKADQTPPRCPVCGHALTRRTHDQERTYQTRFGPVRIRRLRGWCQRCRAWRFAADHVLGLSDTGSASLCRQYQCRGPVLRAVER